MPEEIINFEKNKEVRIFIQNNIAIELELINGNIEIFGCPIPLHLKKIFTTTSFPVYTITEGSFKIISNSSIYYYISDDSSSKLYYIKFIENLLEIPTIINDFLLN